MKTKIKPLPRYGLAIILMLAGSPKLVKAEEESLLDSHTVTVSENGINTSI